MKNDNSTDSLNEEYNIMLTEKSFQNPEELVKSLNLFPIVLKIDDLRTKLFDIYKNVEDVLKTSNYNDKIKNELLVFSKNIKSVGISKFTHNTFETIAFNYKINNIPLSLNLETRENGKHFFVFGEIICTNEIFKYWYLDDWYNPYHLQTYYDLLKFTTTDIFTFLDFIYNLFIGKIGKGIFDIKMKEFGYQLYRTKKIEKKISQISFLKYRFPLLYKHYELGDFRLEIKIIDENKIYNSNITFEYTIGPFNGNRKILFSNLDQTTIPTPKTIIYYYLEITKDQVVNDNKILELNKEEIIINDENREFFKILFYE